MTTLVIATHNSKKAAEMASILSAALPALVVRTLADYPGAPEPEETGSTYAGNALIKARSALAHTGELCLADDAGLEIDALPDELGVWSKRFAGEDSSFEQKMSLVLEQLIGVPEEQRTARFKCCVALVGHDGGETVVEETCEGRIALAPSGTGGFGYDPIFWIPEHGCTMADLSSEQKHAVSHRGKALRRLVTELRPLA